MVGTGLIAAAAKVGPHGSMVIVQLFTASYIVLSKFIIVRGINPSVFNFYQIIVATIFMALLAFLIERRNKPPLNIKIICWIFLMGFLGVTFVQNMLTASLYFIVATTDSAVLNMLPVVTYSLSVVTRQEKLQLSTWWGRGKLIGTLLSVSGALTLMLWNGTTVVRLSTNNNSSSLAHWILGLAMILAAIVAYSSWMLLLRSTLNMYPAEFSLVTLMFFFAGLQQAVIVAITSHKSYQWRLKWNLELLDIFVGGILNSALSNLIITWCSATKGAIFVASFVPLSLVLTVIFESTFLRTPLHIGSIVGSTVILVGLYIFLWSKSKEEESQFIDAYDSINSPSLP